MSQIWISALTGKKKSCFTDEGVVLRTNTHTCCTHIHTHEGVMLWRDSLICVAWLTHMCDGTYFYPCHTCERFRISLVTHMNESRHTWMSHVTHMRNMSHIWMSHVTHVNDSEWVMSHVCMHLFTRKGWRRCIRCLKFQVSFRKRATNYSVLLRGMTYNDKASYAFLHTNEKVISNVWMNHVSHMS